MIANSQPWRRELLAVADRLDGVTASFDEEDQELDFLIERDLMVSAFAMRRLADSHKVPDSTWTQQISVTEFPPLEGVKVRDWADVDKYDYERAKETTTTLPRLCNLIIHSFMLTYERSDFDSTAPICGFMVTSDRTRQRAMYRVEMTTYLDLVRTVAVEDVMGLIMQPDSDGEWSYQALTAAESIEHGPPASGFGDSGEPPS